jgi:hypothetical protein
LDFDPDVLLLTPCSRSPAAAMPDVQKLTQQPAYTLLNPAFLLLLRVVDFDSDVLLLCACNQPTALAALPSAAAAGVGL